jgi:dolichol-phosphate mannosyltransferase
MKLSISSEVKKQRTVKLSIIMPVYNEGEVIEKTIKNVEAIVKTPHELLIVYDMDEDTSIPPVRKFQKKHSNVELIKNAYGGGALNALKTGINYSKGEAVCIMMSDLTDDPKVLNKMIKKFDEGFDVIAASRYMKGGKQIGGPKIKKLLTLTAGLSLHYFFGLPVHDATNSFRLYSKKFLDKTKIESDGGFEVATELTTKAHFNGYKVTEVPTTWTYLDKESRFNMKKWIPKYLKWYLWAVKMRIYGYPKK